MMLLESRYYRSPSSAGESGMSEAEIGYKINEPITEAQFINSL